VHSLILWTIAILASPIVGGVLLSFSTALRPVSNQATIRQRTKSGDRTKATVPVSQLPIPSGDEQLLADCGLMSADAYEPKGHQKITNNGRTWCLDPNVPGPESGKYWQTPQLTYRLWLDHTRRTVCLAFRGSYLPMDWYSNFRWITCMIPFVEDHYEQTVRMTPIIVNYIRRAQPEYRIVAAGHSLGGGLAQTAAYAACGAIDTVFAFDSSPVTKHRAGQHCKARPQRFYRLYEQSEILSYIRLWLRLALGLTASAPHIMEIKVHLMRGRAAFSRHSIKCLAPKLKEQLR
jgi:hypothetical protein